MSTIGASLERSGLGVDPVRIVSRRRTAKRAARSTPAAASGGGRISDGLPQSMSSSRHVAGANGGDEDGAGDDGDDEDGEAFFTAVASQTSQQPSRRVALASIVLAAASVGDVRDPSAIASTSEPIVGDCPECVGVVNDLLNSCPPETEACVSSQDDDEYHFTAPWAYPGDRATAMRRLVAVATGAETGRIAGEASPGADAGASIDVYGRDKREVAEFIVGATGAFIRGGGRDSLPPKPPIRGAPSRGGGGMGVGLVGKVFGADDAGAGSISATAVRVAAYDEAAGYVRLVAGGDTAVKAGGDTAVKEGDTAVARGDVDTAGGDLGTFDVELLFWDDDEVVNVRVASRDAPTNGRWSLSYVDGVRFNKNAARDLAEALRISLGWEVLPVISEFDPRFNNGKRLWFEKALSPFVDPSVMDAPRGGKGPYSR